MPLVSCWCLSKLHRRGVSGKLSQRTMKNQTFSTVMCFTAWVDGSFILHVHWCCSGVLTTLKTDLQPIYYTSFSWPDFLSLCFFAVQTNKICEKGENGWAHSPEQGMRETFTKPQKFKNIGSDSSGYFSDIFCSCAEKFSFSEAC